MCVFGWLVGRGSDDRLVQQKTTVQKKETLPNQ
jgi:hypothetical protein